MYLKQLITRLEELPKDTILPIGICEPHSYRGYYDQLAFEPCENQPVTEAIHIAKSAVGTTYEGYKGGEFTMTEYTDVWLAHYGCITCLDGIDNIAYIFEKLESSKVARLEEENKNLLAANRDLKLHFDVLYEDYKKSKEALKKIYDEVDLDAMDDNDELQRQLSKIAIIAFSVLKDRS